MVCLSMSPFHCIVNNYSPVYTLGGARPLGLQKCTMTRGHRYNTMKNSFTPLNILQNAPVRPSLPANS